MARMKKVEAVPVTSSDMAGRLRETGHPVLIRAAERLDAGQVVAVPGYTLYRHVGREYLQFAHVFRVQVSADGRTEGVRPRAAF